MINIFLKIVFIKKSRTYVSLSLKRCAQIKADLGLCCLSVWGEGTPSREITLTWNIGRFSHFVILLTHSTLDNFFSRQQFEIFFFFFTGNRILIGHFMQIVSNGDNWHGISNPVFWENIINLSTAELAQKMVKIKGNNLSPTLDPIIPLRVTPIFER